MSWEDQGRQERGRFGHGTSGVEAGGTEAAVAERPVDVVAAVGQAAVAALGGAAGRQFGVMLEQGGLLDLRDALPVLAAASGVAAERFRAAVVGPGFTKAGAEALREAGRVLSEGRGDTAALETAGAKLAAAFAGVAGEDHGYALNYAADMARYAVANGALGVGPVEAVLVQARTVPIGPVPFPGALPPQMTPGTPERRDLGRHEQEVLRRFLRWLTYGNGSSDMFPPPPLASPMEAPEKEELPSKENEADSKPTGTTASSPDPDGDKPSDKRASIKDAKDKLPNSMKRGEFGQISGFKEGLADSSKAATEASQDAIAELKARGVTKDAIQAFKDFYTREAVRNPNNASTVHREKLLQDILRRY